MNWGRAKTILIILFLITDLFLFVVLMQTKSGIANIPKETIQQTCELMNARGIAIQAEQIPAKRVQNRNIIMQNFFAEPDACAEKLLGDGAGLVTSDQQNYQFVYENEKGTLLIDGMGVTFHRAKEIKAFPGEKRSEENAKQVLFAGLRDIGIQQKDLAIVQVEETDGIYKFALIPVYQKHNIYGVDLQVTCDSEEIIHLTGHWFYGTKIENHQEQLTDITAVLSSMVFREDRAPMKITAIENSYYIAEEYLNSREISTVPIYVITDDARGKHIFDARDGALIERN